MTSTQEPNTMAPQPIPFCKRSMPLLTVHAIIGSQAFQNGRYHICFSIGLDKGVVKCLIVHIHTACG